MPPLKMLVPKYSRRLTLACSLRTFVFAYKIFRQRKGVLHEKRNWHDTRYFKTLDFVTSMLIRLCKCSPDAAIIDSPITSTVLDLRGMNLSRHGVNMSPFAYNVRYIVYQSY